MDHRSVGFYRQPGPASSSPFCPSHTLKEVVECAFIAHGLVYGSRFCSRVSADCRCCAHCSTDRFSVARPAVSKERTHCVQHGASQTRLSAAIRRV